MEVHHHSKPLGTGHSPRKKWAHYFWEFFMLFLAVFCGFLAENQREHYVEHQREKKFMRSLSYDLRQDTAEINRSIREVKNSRNFQDSVLLFLNQYIPTAYLPLRYKFLITWSLNRFSVVFNDVTAMQLKNAGNLRLIRNQQIIRKISEYWTQQGNTGIALERYLIYRNRNREFNERLFDFAEIELAEDSLIDMPVKGMKVITTDRQLWAEYKNNFAHSRLTTASVLNHLEKQKKIADELIRALNDEYNLE